MDNNDFFDIEEQIKKREARRKRRKRNQFLVYFTVFFLLCAVVSGGVYGVSRILPAGSSAGNGPDREPGSVQEPDSQSGMSQQVSDLLDDEIEEPDISDYIPELTPEEKLDEIIGQLISAMPLEDKVAGLFIVTPEAITGVKTAQKAGESTKEALNANPVGGLIYFAKNIQSGEQITEMISNSVVYNRYPMFIAVDEEGGRVSRVADAGLGINVGSHAVIGAVGNPDNAYLAGQRIANYLTPLGFNLDFAPVADINNVEGSIIGDRSFGSDATLVAQMVSAMVKGLEESGVSSCLKHFPGIGSSTEDTHEGLASTGRSAEDFRNNEFKVYEAGIEAGVDFIMITHMSAPGLTGDQTSATFSKTIVTDILRNELGFEGVIITDALNMKAIADYNGADDAAILALKAGCDMLLMPEDYKIAYTAVLEAVQNGTISEERINDSLKRIYRIKYADMMPEE